MPLGLGSLIAVLEAQGVSVDFADLYLRNHPVGSVQRFDLVGIYANTICYRGTLSILNQLWAAKQRGWTGSVAVGGPHTSVLPHTIPAWVDYVVQGEGEKAILDIVEGRASRGIIRAPRIRDLDALPRPAYDRLSKLPYDRTNHVLPHSHNIFSMNTSRGCPFSCTFCSVSSIWGRQYSSFSAERIIDDIRFLVTDLGADGIYFREDNFTADTGRTRRFCHLMIDGRIRVPWACETRVDTLDSGLVGLMRQAGCRGVYLGLEAATDSLLTYYKKGFSVGDIRRALSAIKQVGIHIYASFIIDTPAETLEDRLAILRLVEEFGIHDYYLNHFVGIPTSPLYEEVVALNAYEEMDDVGVVHVPRKEFPVHRGRQEVLGVNRGGRFSNSLRGWRRQLLHPRVAVKKGLHYLAERL